MYPRRLENGVPEHITRDCEVTVRKPKAIFAVGLMPLLSMPGGADAQLLPAEPALYIGDAVDGLATCGCRCRVCAAGRSVNWARRRA